MFVLFRVFIQWGFNFFRFDMLLRLFLIKIALDGVEDAVDELGCFVSGEPSRDFQGFVDGDSARSGFVEEFVDGESQDVAIDDRHAGYAPMFGARTYALVERFQTRERSRRETGREFTRRFLNVGIAQLSPVGFQN